MGPPGQTKNDTDLKLGTHTPLGHIWKLFFFFVCFWPWGLLALKNFRVTRIFRLLFISTSRVFNITGTLKVVKFRIVHLHLRSSMVWITSYTTLRPPKKKNSRKILITLILLIFVSIKCISKDGEKIFWEKWKFLLKTAIYLFSV